MFHNIIKVKEIKSILNNQQAWLSTCESATLGLLAYTLTTVDGASTFYKGSVIAYDKNFKESFFETKFDKTIDFKCTEVLAKKVSEKTNSDYSIAVCGNAGSHPIENQKTGIFYVSFYYKKTNSFHNFHFQITGDSMSRQAYQTSAVNKIITEFCSYLKK